MRKPRREKSFRIQSTIFTKHTSRLTVDGLYLRPRETRRRSRNPRFTWYPRRVARGRGLPTASIGTINLAGRRMEIRYTLFQEGVVFSMCGAFTSTLPKESQLGNRFAYPRSKGMAR